MVDPTGPGRGDVPPAIRQCPKCMATRTLDRTMWDGGRRKMRAAAQDACHIAARYRIITANREAMEACRKRANTANEAARWTISVEASKVTR